MEISYLKPFVIGHDDRGHRVVHITIPRQATPTPPLSRRIIEIEREQTGPALVSFTITLLQKKPSYTLGKSLP